VLRDDHHQTAEGEDWTPPQVQVLLFSSRAMGPASIRQLSVSVSCPWGSWGSCLCVMHLVVSLQLHTSISLAGVATHQLGDVGRGVHWSSDLFGMAGFHTH
jgi:hypothetical protein